MITLKQQFARRLRKLRIEQGYTQEAFADKCGFARTYMSRMENGGGNPSLYALGVLATALNMTVGELLTFDEKINK